MHDPRDQPGGQHQPVGDQAVGERRDRRVAAADAGERQRRGQARPRRRRCRRASAGSGPAAARRRRPAGPARSAGCAPTAVIAVTSASRSKSQRPTAAPQAHEQAVTEALGDLVALDDEAVGQRRRQRAVARQPLADARPRSGRPSAASARCARPPGRRASIATKRPRPSDAGLEQRLGDAQAEDDGRQRQHRQDAEPGDLQDGRRRQAGRDRRARHVGRC